MDQNGWFKVPKMTRNWGWHEGTSTTQPRATQDEPSLPEDPSDKPSAPMTHSALDLIDDVSRIMRVKILRASDRCNMILYTEYSWHLFVAISFCNTQKVSEDLLLGWKPPSIWSTRVGEWSGWERVVNLHKIGPCPRFGGFLFRTHLETRPATDIYILDISTINPFAKSSQESYLESCWSSNFIPWAGKHNIFLLVLGREWGNDPYNY